MINVALFYRELRPGGHSIEGIFAEIQQQLASSVNFTIFQVNPKKSRAANILDASKVQADVYHITGDCNYLAVGLPKKKTILTVHDIGHYEKTLQGIRKLIYGLVWWRVPLFAAGTITTVSNFTKTKLVRVFKVNSKKIRVIHNPVFAGFTRHPKCVNKERPRILAIGSGHNKNIERLIEAVKVMPCVLILIRSLSSQQREMLESSKVAYEHYEGLDLPGIQEQYRMADVLFFASTYEGFGLPIIEAQAVGRPVLTSNVASMPETGSDGALYVDPFDVNAIRNGLITLISNEEAAGRLVEAGYRNAARFSLSAIAQEYLHLYEEVAANGS